MTNQTKYPNIKQRMEKYHNTKIELASWQEPGPGDEFSPSSIMLTVTVKDEYTGEVLLKLEGYYDFDNLMFDLDRKMADI